MIISSFSLKQLSKSLVKSASSNSSSSSGSGSSIQPCLLISSFKSEYSTASTSPQAKASRKVNNTSRNSNNNNSLSASASANNDTAKLRLVDYLTGKAALQKQVKMDHVSGLPLTFYDPPYLEREAPYPNYQELNINLKGYDYTSLDCFFKYVEKLCASLRVELVEAYPMPARSLKIRTLQPFSSNLEKEYTLSKYHRVVRVRNVKSTVAPLLFEIIQLNLPEGVQLNVSVPTVDEDEFRYVPDLELDEMRAKLEEYSKKPNDSAVAAATTTKASPPAAAAAATAATNKKVVEKK
jgi:large subunit ribosomal protein L48